MAEDAITVDAVFEDGFLRPLVPLALPANQRVTLIVQAASEQAVWPENVGAIYKEIADEDHRLAELARLHAALGHKPLNRTWAKLELFLGLFAAGVGLLLGMWAVSRPAEVEWSPAILGLALFVLGGYLTLAGHRSHLYQSNNELTSLLLEHLERLEGKG